MLPEPSHAHSQIANVGFVGLAFRLSKGSSSVLSVQNTGEGGSRLLLMLACSSESNFADHCCLVPLSPDFVL